MRTDRSKHSSKVACWISGCNYFFSATLIRAIQMIIINYDYIYY